MSQDMMTIHGNLSSLPATRDDETVQVEEAPEPVNASLTALLETAAEFDRAVRAGEVVPPTVYDLPTLKRMREEISREVEDMTVPCPGKKYPAHLTDGDHEATTGSGLGTDVRRNLAAEIAVKDARIAELEASVAGMRDWMTHYRDVTMTKQLWEDMGGLKKDDPWAVELGKRFQAKTAEIDAILGEGKPDVQA